ncbi:MAG: DUF4214 domain-containing protein, partial [Gammaproteobacteria bacterium]|nr:DUF4214 domain-containing protein [Gammaproteobacteria bacterium]
GNAVTVTINPKITTSTYDASTGVLVVTGTNIQANGSGDDIDASQFTFTGESGATYQLTDTPDVERSSVTQFTLTLSATDKTEVNQMLNKDGLSSTGGTAYKLEAGDDWNTNVTAGDTSDTDTGNTITVSNVSAPAISGAGYDVATGVLTVNGTNFLKRDGANNDIDVTKLTVISAGGAFLHTLTSNNVEITSATTFTVILNSADQTAVELFLNKNGAISNDGSGYALNAGEDWAVGADVSVDVIDTGNGLNVSNVAVPTITDATYDAVTGVLNVTGTGFLLLSGLNNDIELTKLIIEGEGGASHTLTGSNIDITSGTTFSITLSGADKAAVNQIINKDGTQSTGGSNYNLQANENWALGADSVVNVVDDSGNTITASNVAAPRITSAGYDANTNVLTVSGTGLLQKSGPANDIDISQLTFTGEGGTTYTLTSTSDVEITSGTQFSITLTGADLFNVEVLLNKNGTTSADNTTYNLAAEEDWAAGADGAVNVDDTTDNGITVSNYTPPTITSAIYDWSTGQLVITGTNFVNKSGGANDIDVSMLTFTGQNGATYTLTDSNDAEITSATSVTLTLSETDQLNVHGLLNKNDTASSDGTTYNLAAADNWLTGSPEALDISDATGNGITVTNVAIPTITSAVYNADSGDLTVTGTNLFSQIGANNDVDISRLILTGGIGDATYTLTSAADVEITSTTSFSLTLTGADKTQVDLLLDQLGTTSIGGSTYNIEALDNWLAAADAATDISDSTNAVTVIVNPKITSATYDTSTGVLVVTGTNIQANGGGTDIDASRFTITGEAGATYPLTDTSDVNRDLATQFTLNLSVTDKTAVNLLLNNVGTTSRDATTYNLAAADDWNTGFTAGDTSDTTGNSISVANTAPTLANLNGDNVTFILGSSGTYLDATDDATVADTTSVNFDGGNVTASIVTNAQAGEDMLSIDNVGSITTSGSNVNHSGVTIGSFAGGSGGVNLIITLNVDATVARVQDLVRALQYTDTDG